MFPKIAYKLLVISTCTLIESPYHLNYHLHGTHWMAHRFLDVNQVSCDYYTKRWINGPDLIIVVLVENGCLQVLAQNKIVAFEVVFEHEHEWGYVGEDGVLEIEQVEGHAGRSSIPDS